MNNKFKFRLFTVISIVVLCISFTVRSFQNDTFYIIKLGDYIVHNGIDMMDHFSFISGLSYSYPHWLYDVFIYYIYSLFGYMGIYISNIIFFILLVLSIYYISLRVIRNEFISSFNSILSIILLYGFITARSQIVSMILFIWEVYFIIRLCESGNKWYSFGLIIISLLLANIHATIWPMYFILYLPFIFEYLIYFIKGKIGRKKFKGVKLGIDGVVDKLIILDNKYIKVLIITLIISLFMGILSPSKICYSYVFKIMMGNSQSYIAEHSPLVVLYNPVFIGVVMLLFMVLIFTKVKIKLSDICMILGLIFMSISSTRHISLFYLIGLLFIWRLCSNFIYLSKDRTLDILVNVICNKYIYILLIFIVLVCGYFKFIDNSRDDFIRDSEYPVGAVDYIKNNIDIYNVRIFNNYNYGSYLLFNDIPVFIDSRSDLYMDEFNEMEYDIFDDYMDIVFNYEKKFIYYDIDYVLEYVDNELSLILYRDSNYRVVYEDEYFVLFERVS
jgi:hypothetical protein